MNIFVIVEENVDYDYEEDPILIGVNLLKAFPRKEYAEQYINDLSVKYNRPRTDLEIVEVELV